MRLILKVRGLFKFTCTGVVVKVHTKLQDLCRSSLIIIDIRVHLQLGLHFQLLQPVYR